MASTKYYYPEPVLLDRSLAQSFWDCYTGCKDEKDETLKYFKERLNQIYQKNKLVSFLISASLLVLGIIFVSVSMIWVFGGLEYSFASLLLGLVKMALIFLFIFFVIAFGPLLYELAWELFDDLKRSWQMVREFGAGNLIFERTGFLQRSLNPGDHLNDYLENEREKKKRKGLMIFGMLFVLLFGALFFNIIKKKTPVDIPIVAAEPGTKISFLDLVKPSKSRKLYYPKGILRRVRGHSPQAGMGAGGGGRREEKDYISQGRIPQRLDEGQSALITPSPYPWTNLPPIEARLKEIPYPSPKKEDVSIGHPASENADLSSGTGYYGGMGSQTALGIGNTKAQAFQSNSDGQIAGEGEGGGNGYGPGSKNGTGSSLRGSETGTEIGKGSLGPGGFGGGPTHDSSSNKGVSSGEDVFKDVVIIFLPQPLYTKEARELGIEGTVLLQAKFRADKTVQILDKSILMGLGHGLDEVATEAAMKIGFRPATYNGRPVDRDMKVEVIFQQGDGRAKVRLR